MAELPRAASAASPSSNSRNSRQGKPQVARAADLRRGRWLAQRAVFARLIRWAAGGNRMADGRLWFTTSRGLAVFDPKARKRTRYTPAVASGGDDRGWKAGGSQRGSAQSAARQPAHRIPLHGDPFKRARTGAVFVQAGRARPGLGAGRRAARDGLQQSAATAIPVSTCAPICPAARGARSRTHSTVLPHFYETAWFRWRAE